MEVWKSARAIREIHTELQEAIDAGDLGRLQNACDALLLYTNGAPMQLLFLANDVLTTVAETADKNGDAESAKMLIALAANVDDMWHEWKAREQDDGPDMPDCSLN